MCYRIITLSVRSKKFPGELPGGPVVRVLPHTSTAGAMGSIPGPEAKISHATQGNQKKKKKKKKNNNWYLFQKWIPYFTVSIMYCPEWWIKTIKK